MFINTKIEIQNVRKGFASDKGRLDVITDLEFKVGDGQTGKLTTDLRQQLVSLQKGTTNDERGWTRLIPA